MNKTNKSPTFLSSEEKERLWKEGGKEEELDEGLYSMSDVLWRKLKQGLGKLEDVLRIFFLKKFFFLLFSSFKCLMNYVQANIKVKYMCKLKTRIWAFDHFLWEGGADQVVTQKIKFVNMTHCLGNSKPWCMNGALLKARKTRCNDRGQNCTLNL